MRSMSVLLLTAALGACTTGPQPGRTANAEAHLQQEPAQQRGAKLDVSGAIACELLDRGLERQVTRNGVSGKAGEPAFQLQFGSCFGHNLASFFR